MQTEYDIKRAIERVEYELQESMIRNFDRHRAEELAEGFNWPQWQQIQLEALEQYKRDNLAKYSVTFDEINKSSGKLFRDTAKRSEKNALKWLGKYKVVKTGFTGINEGKLNALIEATKADFIRGEMALLRLANDQYRRVIFDAQVYAATCGTYEKAVDMATKDFLKAGINCIEYKNGARHTMSDYASMALRTGQKRAYLMGEGNARDMCGVHTVRVNNRVDACPLCIEWLGKVLIDDVYGGGTLYEAQSEGLPLLSEAIAEGFLHPNCKDMYSTYIEGISRPGKKLTREELTEATDSYNTDQALNYAVNMANSYARMGNLSLDEENARIYTQRAEAWENRAKALRGK